MWHWTSGIKFTWENNYPSKITVVLEHSGGGLLYKTDHLTSL